MSRAVVVAAIVLGACGGSLPEATQRDAERAHVELAALQRGRQLVLGKCSACHRPPAPADVLRDAWPAKVTEMAARSHLDATEHQLIEAYYVTLAPR